MTLRASQYNTVAGDRYVSLGQCTDDPVFSIDGVSRRQQFAGRLFTQHQASIVVAREERRVGLAAGNPFEE